VKRAADQNQVSIQTAASAARRRIAFAGLLALAGAPARGADPTSTSPGDVRFFRVASSDFDRFTRAPSLVLQAWMQTHYWRALAYPPYFDSRLSWFPDAWAYKDLYAIYTDSPLVTAHPEWILRDADGNPLYIPFACSDGTCPQYAGDPGNPDFRANWIAEMAGILAKGYRGMFVDDVNMLLRVGDGTGQAVAPVDPRTGTQMTPSQWRRYIGQFAAEIRVAFPQAEIVHNAIWYAGHDDPDIQRELRNADVVNLERGVNDEGLRGGSGRFGLETFFAHVDWLHTRGLSVVFDADADDDRPREYGLAAYFLISSGSDGLGNESGGTPADWWPGYDVSLGDDLGPRYAWNGLLRRDFARGTVLLNEPDQDPQTVDLGGVYADLAGRRRVSVTLGPAEGAILRTLAVIPPGPPAGVCDGPVVLPAGGGAFDGTTVGGGAEAGTCGGAAAPEAVFQWTPATSGAALIHTCRPGHTDHDTVLYLRSDTCAGDELACNDDRQACGVTTAGDPILGSVVTAVVTAGTTYFIVVDGDGEESGDFRLTVVPPGAAAL